MKREKSSPLIETIGDEDQERRIRIWALVDGAEDTDGEFSPTEAFKSKMDWFVNDHKAPMTMNHSHRVIGHWDSYGFAKHPETGTDAMWLEGVVHRGPNNGPFPFADKVWNDAKAKKVKGGSWAGNILKEVIEDDLDTFQQKVTNSDVLPFSWGIVVDDDTGVQNPALPESTVIELNERAKTVKNPDKLNISEPKSEHITNTDKPKSEESSMAEPEIKEEVKTEVPPAKVETPAPVVVEETKTEAPSYLSIADFDKFKTEVMSMIEQLKCAATCADKGHDDKKEKEKTEAPNIEQMVADKVEEKFKAVTETVTTPQPPMPGAKSKTEEKKKIENVAEYNKLSLKQRIKIQESYTED